MQKNERPSTFSAILHGQCPRCRMGTIFQSSRLRRFPQMNTECPVCSLRFEREEGYFLGAMYIGYLLGLILIVLFAAAFWLGLHLTLYRSFVWGMALFLPFAVPLTFLARVLWIYLDQAVDPER